ncbi:MAG: hypothetical protein Q8K75_07900 [Chlamydiales bacterium]|nr:hypothetical protein [Chlamydiales bacterium]
MNRLATISVIFALSVCGTLVAFENQAIRNRLGAELYDARVREASIDGHELLVIGEQHDLPEFQELKKWLVKQALNGKIALFLEGVNRDGQFESIYRQGLGGTGDEPIFGLEDPAAQLVDLAIMCRYKALGALSGYDVPCKETLLNLSAMTVYGQQVWNELPNYQLPQEVASLLRALNPLVKAISDAEDPRDRLNKFEEVISGSQWSKVSERFSNVAWDVLYRLFGLVAVSYAPEVPDELYTLTQSSLQNLPDSKSFALWFSVNSAYREHLYASSIDQLLPELIPSLPVVVVVGGEHLRILDVLEARANSEKTSPSLH